MSVSFKDCGMNLTGSFLHLGAIIEFSFVITNKSYTLKVRFLDCFMHSLCVNFFHVCNVLCVLHVCGLLNVESIQNMDAFKLLN